MKRLFGPVAITRLSTLSFVLGLLLCAGACESDSEPEGSNATGDLTPREPGEGGDPIVVIARVLESPRPPPCGSSTYRVAVRYEVMRTLEGSLSEEEILVRQDCVEAERPEGNAGPIVVGDVHILTLDPAPYRTARRVQWIPRRTDLAEGS